MLYRSFIKVLITRRNEFINFPPNDQAMFNSIKTFQGKSKLPHVAGAIDGTPIEIRKP